MHLSHDLPSRTARFLFAVVLLLIWSGAADPVTTRGAVQQEASAPTPEQFAKVADRLARVFPAVEKEDAQIPRDTFDLNVILQRTGPDTTAIFQWVRDQTAWVPYRGRLRGATGVLMDRLGNSLDRSLLLVEMLRTTGHTVRLARCQLTQEQAKGFVSRIATSPAAAPATTQDAQAVEAVVARCASESGIDAPDLRRAYETARVDAEQRAETLTTRVVEQTRFLSDAVAGAMGAADSSAQTEMLSALADHWWVQVRNKDHWDDLDPQLSDSQPGSKLAEPQSTIPVPGPVARIELPPEEQQIVSVRVWVDQLSAGKVQSRRVLEAALRPADVLGKYITLANMPMQWPQDSSLFSDEQPQSRFKEIVLKQHEWLPVLAVGKDVTMAGSFNDAGDVNEKPNLAALAGTGKSVTGAAQKVVGAFDVGDNGAAAASKPSSGKLVGEWVEYELRGPGREPRHFRRDIYHMEGIDDPTALGSTGPLTETQQLRRGLALLSRVELLPMPCQFSAAWVEHLSATRLLANRDVLPELLRDPNLPQRKSLSTDLANLSPQPGPLYGWAVMRRALSRSAAQTCLAEPNLVTFVTSGQLSDAGDISGRQAIDIIFNRIALRPGAKASSAKIGIEQGVLDTNLEAILLSGRGSRPHNVSEMLALSDAQGVKWQTITNRDDPQLARLQISGEARRHMLEDLANGYAINAPSKPVSIDGQAAFGWWRIDLRTGETLGIMESGAGSSLVEFAVLMSVIFIMAYMMGYLGCAGKGAVSSGKLKWCVSCAVIAGVLAVVTLFAILLEAPMGVNLLIFGSDLFLGGGVCTAGSLHD